MNLIEHIGEEIFDQINIALNRFANHGVPTDSTEIYIVNASLTLLYSRIKFQIANFFHRSLNTSTTNKDSNSSSDESNEKDTSTVKSNSNMLVEEEENDNYISNDNSIDTRPNMNEATTLNIDNDLEPIVSMRDSILSHLTILMNNEVNLQTTTDDQYNYDLKTSTEKKNMSPNFLKILSP